MQDVRTVTPYYSGKSIRLTPLAFKQVIGHSEATCYYCGCQQFRAGDQIRINEWNADETKLTGLYIMRYVVKVTDAIALMGDDDSVTLHLSPFKPLSSCDEF
jgi:hypothetical protein